MNTVLCICNDATASESVVCLTHDTMQAESERNLWTNGNITIGKSLPNDEKISFYYGTRCPDKVSNIQNDGKSILLLKLYTCRLDSI